MKMPRELGAVGPREEHPHTLLSQWRMPEVAGPLEPVAPGWSGRPGDPSLIGCAAGRK